MIQSAGMMKTVIFAAILARSGGGALMSQSVLPEARILASAIPATAGPWLSEADLVFDAAGSSSSSSAGMRGS